MNPGCKNPQKTEPPEDPKIPRGLYPETFWKLFGEQYAYTQHQPRLVAEAAACTKAVYFCIVIAAGAGNVILSRIMVKADECKIIEAYMKAKRKIGSILSSFHKHVC